MPAAPTLPTTIVAGVTTGHPADSATVHGILNGIYLSSIGTTQTAGFTLTQAMSGEFIRVNSASSVAIVVPSLAVGTSIEIGRQGAGAITLTASGVTLRVPAGATASPRVQYSTMSLLWTSATEVWVGGDLT